MRYNPKDRIGVNETERIFISEFNWIFREQSIVDVGIDALVEQSENGNPTGKFIALQIKSGKGNFHISKNKITYYLSNIHYNYWLNFDIPVILVAHIPELNETFWEEITERKIKKANKKWKLEIPANNKLNIKAKSHLTKILSSSDKEYTSIKIFQGEKIEEQTIFDLIEKSNCISDAVESISKTVQFLEELTLKINESNEKIIQYSNSGKTSKSPEVIATVKGFAKNIIIYSRRLENESMIFSETIGEGVFAYEQALILYYYFTNDNLNLTSSLESIYGVPAAFDEAINGVQFLGDKTNELPNGYNPLKIAKSSMLPVLDMITNEYLTAKAIMINLIDKLENKLKNNC